jgi:putative transposase
MWLERHLFALI